MEQRCTLCQIHPASPQFRVCTDCGAKLGLVPLPPPTRPPIPCARCNSSRFIRVVPRVHTTALIHAATINPGDVYGSQELASPMVLTREPAIANHLIRQGRDVSYNSLGHGIGVLETYVCAGCGFVEWYCQDPQSIPIGPEYNTDEVDYGTQTPYR